MRKESGVILPIKLRITPNRRQTARGLYLFYASFLGTENKIDSSEEPIVCSYGFADRLAGIRRRADKFPI